MKKLPTPEEIVKQLPLNETAQNFIKKAQTTAKNIFSKKINKIAVFVGPCSIHNEKEIIEYALKLKKLSLNKHIFPVMRFCYEKPRTTTGWKGFLYDPYLDGSDNIEDGITKTRKLMLKLTEMEIPLACEILDPLTINYFKDLITWGFIGSRTSTSQIHRQLASSLPFVVGIKNNNEGNLDTAINSLVSTRAKHSYLNISNEGSISSFYSSGNPYSHIILRGSDTKPNYKKKHILKLYKKLKENNLQSPLIVDCSHGNSQKDLSKQKKCFKTVLKQMKKDPNIIGIMLESYLNEGNQPLSKNLKQGISVTDPCLSWEDTKKMFLNLSSNFLLPNLR